jgi:uncharacterized protein YfaS (alpha-2-macroglobulin family)
MKSILLGIPVLFLTACAAITNPGAVQDLINAEDSLAPINLAEPAEIEFMSPENQSTGINGQAAITFLWKQPVLALQNHQAAKAFLEANLTLSPAHPGEWRTLGTSGIMYQPKTPWPASTQFSLTATSELLKDFRYGFETERLALESVKSENIVGKIPLELNFNQAVDLSTFAQNLSLVASNNALPPLKIDIGYGTLLNENDEPQQNTHQLELVPRDLWPENQSYRLEIKPGNYSAEGNLPLEKPLTAEFRTQGPLTVTRFDAPLLHTRSLVFNFSSLVSTKTFAENLVISPAPKVPLVEGALKYFVDNEYDTTSFYVSPPEGAWDPEVQYEISLKPTFQDKAGRTLTDFGPVVFQTNLETFFTGVYMPQNYSVFESEAVIKPTFAYGGKVERVEATLNGVVKDYPLESSLKNRQIFELDLRRDFAELFTNNGALLPGDYRLKIQAYFEEKDRSVTYDARFFVSDFSVEIKQAANNSIQVLAQAYPTEPAISENLSIEYFVGDWQSEERWQQFDNVESGFKVEIPENQLKTVKVTAGDKVGYGSPYFNNGMSVWDAQADFGDWQYNQDYSGVVFTERPLYKPGQELFFKGFLRELNLYGKNFPLQPVTDQTPARAYEIVIFDPEYEELDRFKGTTEGGSFDGRYQLPETLKLGNYRLVFNILSETGESEFSVETPFWVQEYRKPNFLISNRFSQPQALAEETITATIEAQYSFGGAIVDRPVNYTVTLFGNEPCRFWCWGLQARKDLVVTRGDGRLNAQGQLVLPIDLKDLDLADTQWNLLTVNANVQVSAAEQSATEFSVPFWQANRQFELRAIPHFAAPTTALSLTGRILDLAQKPQAGDTVELKVLQTKWVRNQRKNADDNFYGEWESTEAVIDQLKADTDGDGNFEFNLVTPAEGGEYLFEFKVQDEENRVLSTKKYFWVSGRNLEQVRQNNTNNILWLFPNQNSYAIGETAEVFAPNTDFTPTRVHATLERGEVLQVLDFNADSGTVSFEIEDWMSPNVFVSILMEGQDENGEFGVKWGSHPIKIEDPKRDLKVRLSPEKMIYRPGDEVTLNVETQINNQGVQAEVAIAVVDQSLLALKSRVPLDLMERLIGEWPLGVSTFHTLANYTSASEMEKIMEEVKTIADRMAMGFGGGGGKGDDFKPRGDFRDTAAFIAKLETESDGLAQVKFKLPDNLTTWNIFAAGATKNNAFGTQTSDFMVTLPLLVSEIVPNFLQSGDTVKLGLLVYRDDSEIEAESIKVTLDIPSDLEVVGQRTQTVNVSQEARVYFTVKVKPTQTVKAIDFGFTIQGETTGFKDAVSLNRTVQPPAQTLNAAEFQRTEGDYDLKFTPDPRAISSQLNVKVFASLSNSLDSLVDVARIVNYGCTEQRLSLLASQLYQLNLDKALGKETAVLDPSIIASTRDAIENSFTGQGFAFWETNEQPNFWVTTQVLEKSSLLADYGAPLDQAKLEAAAVWLEAQLLNTCDITLNWRCPDPISRLHAASVLVDFNRIDVNDLDFLTDYTQSLEAKAWWLQATQRLGVLPPALEQTKQSYLTALEQAYIREDRYGFWTETQRAFYSQDERLTALVLETFMQFERFENEYDTIARYLSESQKQNLSGNSAMRVLKTLALYTQTQEQDSVGANFTVLNTTTNETLIKGRLANLQQEQSYENNQQYTASQSLNVSSDKPVLVDFKLTDLLPAEAIMANARGFWIDRSVYPMVGAEASSEEAQDLTLGQNYLVKLQVVTARPHRQVLVEDPIPSGTEIVNFDLDNADKTLEASLDNEACDWGWCQPLFQHKEYRQDRARFFIDYLPAGTHEITYILQPRLEGEYQWLPAKVEEMYFPEVAANSDGKRIQIFQK